MTMIQLRCRNTRKEGRQATSEVASEHKTHKIRWHNQISRLRSFQKVPKEQFLPQSASPPPATRILTELFLSNI